MNFGSIGIQKTVDKIINNFCYTYDLDETEFRKELAQFTASKTSYIGDDNEDGEDAVIPFVGADTIMWVEAASELNRRLFENKKSSLHKQVHDILMEELPIGYVMIDHVIECIGIGKRTLQRRLKQDGVSFRQVLDEARFKLATEFIRKGEMSKTEIAYRLGYCDPNSFYRIYKRWTKSRSVDG